MQNGERADRQLRLERMMREYGTSLLRMCTLQLGDPSLAEDAVQDAFVKAYRQMSGFRGQSSERTWLMSIAINTCRDYLRSSWHRRVDGSLTPDDLPERACESENPDCTVLTEVRKLKPRYREVILLRYYQDLKLGEIAKALGISLSSVKYRLKSAEKQLRKRLEGWYFDEE